MSILLGRSNYGSLEMNLKPIPYYVDPPALSPAIIEEITQIIFEKPTDVEACDIIFIFGGSHPGLWEYGAKAFFNGWGQAIIVTGGYKPNALRHTSWQDDQKTEAEVICRELLRLGVPKDRIYAETQSTNTYENVRFALKVYNFEAISSILAICKSYAVGRQIRTLRAQVAPSMKILPFAFDTKLGGDGPYVTRENWYNYRAGQAYMFANVLKIYQYGKFGHLVPIEKMSPELSTMVQNYFEP